MKYYGIYHAIHDIEHYNILHLYKTSKGIYVRNILSKKMSHIENKNVQNFLNRGTRYVKAKEYYI